MSAINYIFKGKLCLFRTGFVVCGYGFLIDVDYCNRAGCCWLYVELNDQSVSYFFASV